METFLLIFVCAIVLFIVVRLIIKQSPRRIRSTEVINSNNTHEPFLMNVEDVFFITGRGVVVVGKIEKGIINVGDEAEIVGNGSNLRTKILSIEIFQKKLKQAKAGEHVGLCLKGIDKTQVQKGQKIITPGSSSF